MLKFYIILKVSEIYSAKKETNNKLLGMNIHYDLIEIMTKTDLSSNGSFSIITATR